MLSAATLLTVPLSPLMEEAPAYGSTEISSAESSLKTSESSNSLPRLTSLSHGNALKALLTFYPNDLRHASVSFDFISAR